MCSASTNFPYIGDSCIAQMSHDPDDLLWGLLCAASTCHAATALLAQASRGSYWRPYHTLCLVACSSSVSEKSLASPCNIITRRRNNLSCAFSLLAPRKRSEAPPTTYRFPFAPGSEHPTTDRERYNLGGHLYSECLST